MSRKKSPNKSPVRNQPVQPAAPAAVNVNTVFADFIKAASSIGQELEARRHFDKDVEGFLKSKSLVAEFEAWRSASHDPC